MLVKFVKLKFLLPRVPKLLEVFVYPTSLAKRFTNLTDKVSTNPIENFVGKRHVEVSKTEGLILLLTLLVLYRDIFSR